MTSNAVDPYVRRREAARFFHRLFPQLAPWRVQRLAALALSYWERPDRYR